MDRWVPLFSIFLNSPSPEGEASLWFQTEHNSCSTAAFLSLLLSSSHNPDSIFFDTLPAAVQSRLLSFLAIEHHRFCSRSVHQLAIHALQSASLKIDASFYWVRRAALNLLEVSLQYPSIAEISTEVEAIKFSKASNVENEFHALPDWLQEHASTRKSLLPWLPLPPDILPRKTDKRKDIFLCHKPASARADYEQVGSQNFSESESSCPHPLDPDAIEKALALRDELLTAPAVSKSLSDRIKNICLCAGLQNQLEILGLIEPWEADDEVAAVLLSQLCNENGLVPANVLCSFILPKLLILQTPASRVLVESIVGFCKLYPAAAVDALLLPLLLRKEGTNVVLCDVLVKVMKECLHRTHVSAFCQKLLSEESKERRVICLPCHEDSLSKEVVWTEPLFTLFQHILNMEVKFTPDTVDRLVVVIDEMATKFSRSLKFGNFFLCFITKCSHAMKCHQSSLKKAAEKTTTFVTKAILSKF